MEFNKAKCFLKVGHLMGSLATVSPQWACVRCAVGHVASQGASHMVHRPATPHRVCFTFGATTAVRMPVARRDRSQVWTDVRTKEQIVGNISVLAKNVSEQ
jgi:hypothetical protein